MEPPWGVPIEVVEVPAWAPLDEAQRRSLPAISFLVRPDELDHLVARLRSFQAPLYGPVLKMAGQAVGAYFADPDGAPLSFSCPSGYPVEGLARNPGLWVPQPYAW